MSDDDTDTTKTGWDNNDWLKLGFILVSFTEALVMGLIPVKSKSFRESPKILGVANAFSGGVFLAIAIMHIMPEQTGSYSELAENGEISAGLGKFPLPFLLVVVGYTFILIIDKVLFDAHDILDNHHDHGVDPVAQRASMVLRQSMIKYKESIVSQKDLKGSQIQFENALRDTMSKSFKKSEKFAAKVSQAKRRNEVNPTEIDDTDEANERSQSKNQAKLFVDDDQVKLEKSVNKNEQLIKNKKLVEGNKKPSWVDNMTPFILMIGLGVHATFEGLSLGMSKDFNGTLLFAIAIVLHKGAAGMSLGISMTQTFPNEDKFITKLLVLFAIFTPVGVALGWALQSSSELTEIIFSCLAAGSFLYIACSEVIVEEFSISQYRFLKLFAFLFGISIITGLLFIESDGDDPE